MPSRSTLLLLLLLLVLSLAACGRDKEIAEKDVALAERLVTLSRAEAAKLVPEKLEAAEHVIEAAKNDLIAGDYRAALTAAAGGLASAQELNRSIMAKKADLAASFSSLATTLPAMLDSIRSRLDRLASMKAPAVEPDQVARVRGELPDWAVEWQRATEAFKEGDVVTAATTASDVKAKVAEGLAILER